MKDKLYSKGLYRYIIEAWFYGGICIVLKPSIKLNKLYWKMNSKHGDANVMKRAIESYGPERYWSNF